MDFMFAVEPDEQAPCRFAGLSFGVAPVPMNPRESSWRRAALAAGGGSGGETGVASPAIAQERAALLKEIYKRADITKPRNVLGLAKDIPLEQMESLLLAVST